MRCRGRGCLRPRAGREGHRGPARRQRVLSREADARRRSREGASAPGSLITWSELGIPGVQNRDREVPLPATHPGLETRPCRHLPMGVHGDTGTQQPKGRHRPVSVMGQMDEGVGAGPHKRAIWPQTPSGTVGGEKLTRRAMCSIILLTLRCPAQAKPDRKISGWQGTGNRERRLLGTDVLCG